MNIELILRELEIIYKDISDLKSESQNFRDILRKNSDEQNQLSQKLSELNLRSNEFNQEIKSENVYLEIQDLLSILPDLTILAIKEEYISKTLKETKNSLWGRIEAFIGSRIVSRSLEPQKGNSVDAIMSRVEAALRQLDLKKSLAELKRLPDSSSYIFSEVVGRIEKLVEDPLIINQQEN